MTRPVNGKPRWLIERMKEQPAHDGVPEFLDAYLRMKYSAQDIERIKAGWEFQRAPVLWVNESACSVEGAAAALDEAGIPCAASEHFAGVLTTTEAGLTRLAELEAETEGEGEPESDGAPEHLTAGAPGNARGGTGDEDVDSTLDVVRELLAHGGLRVLDDPAALLAVRAAAQAVREISEARQAAAANGQDLNETAESEAYASPHETAAPAPSASERQGDPSEKQVAGGIAEAASEPEEPACATPTPVRVAELCAGAGGMTLPLSAAVGGAARIHACEVSSAEFDKLARALEAAGVTNVDAQRYDSRRFRSETSTYDVILLDPPCTPTGSLYAHDPQLHGSFPEGKIVEYMSLAKSLFLLSLSMMEVGSVLIYTTSSVLHLENEEVIRTCLARSGSMGTFEVEPISPAALGTVDSLPQLPTTCEGTLLTCPSKAAPARFLAKIRRTA